eukprot:jgi/Mesvir1/6708/Mv19951-RA.1
MSLNEIIARKVRSDTGILTLTSRESIRLTTPRLQFESPSLMINGVSYSGGTTITDGSITESKLDAALKTKLNTSVFTSATTGGITWMYPSDPAKRVVFLAANETPPSNALAGAVFFGGAAGDGLVLGSATAPSRNVRLSVTGGASVDYIQFADDSTGVQFKGHWDQIRGKPDLGGLAQLTEVATTNLANEAVTEAKIAASAVTAAKIRAGTITADLLDIPSVSAALAGQVAGVAPADGSIATAQIADAAVTSAKLATGAVTADKLASGSATAAKLAADAVTTDKLAAASVTTAKLADGAVTAAKLATGTIPTSAISDGAITNAKISTNEEDKIRSNRLNVSDVRTAVLSAGSVGTTQLSDSAVATAKIADGAVTPAKLKMPEVADAVFATRTVQQTDLSTDLASSLYRPFDLSSTPGAITWRYSSNTNDRVAFVPPPPRWSPPSRPPSRAFSCAAVSIWTRPISTWTGTTRRSCASSTDVHSERVQDDRVRGQARVPRGEGDRQDQRNAVQPRESGIPVRRFRRPSPFVWETVQVAGGVKTDTLRCNTARVNNTLFDGSISSLAGYDSINQRISALEGGMEGGPITSIVVSRDDAYDTTMSAEITFPSAYKTTGDYAMGLDRVLVTVSGVQGSMTVVDRNSVTSGGASRLTQMSISGANKYKMGIVLTGLFTTSEGTITIAVGGPDRPIQAVDGITFFGGKTAVEVYRTNRPHDVIADVTDTPATDSTPQSVRLSFTPRRSDVSFYQLVPLDERLATHVFIRAFAPDGRQLYRFQRNYTRGLTSNTRYNDYTVSCTQNRFDFTITDLSVLNWARNTPVTSFDLVFDFVNADDNPLLVTSDQTARFELPKVTQSVTLTSATRLLVDQTNSAIARRTETLGNSSYLVSLKFNGVLDQTELSAEALKSLLTIEYRNSASYVAYDRGKWSVEPPAIEGDTIRFFLELLAGNNPQPLPAGFASSLRIVVKDTAETTLTADEGVKQIPDAGTIFAVASAGVISAALSETDIASAHREIAVFTPADFATSLQAEFRCTMSLGYLHADDELKDQYYELHYRNANREVIPATTLAPPEIVVSEQTDTFFVVTADVSPFYAAGYTQGSLFFRTTTPTAGNVPYIPPEASASFILPNLEADKIKSVTFLDRAASGYSGSADKETHSKVDVRVDFGGAVQETDIAALIGVHDPTATSNEYGYKLTKAFWFEYEYADASIRNSTLYLNAELKENHLDTPVDGAYYAIFTVTTWQTKGDVTFTPPANPVRIRATVNGGLLHAAADPAKTFRDMSGATLAMSIGEFMLNSDSPVTDFSTPGAATTSIRATFRDDQEGITMPLPIASIQREDDKNYSVTVVTSEIPKFVTKGVLTLNMDQGHTKSALTGIPAAPSALSFPMNRPEPLVPRFSIGELPFIRTPTEATFEDQELHARGRGRRRTGQGLHPQFVLAYGDLSVYGINTGTITATFPSDAVADSAGRGNLARSASTLFQLLATPLSFDIFPLEGAPPNLTTPATSGGFIIVDGEIYVEVQWNHPVKLAEHNDANTTANFGMDKLDIIFFPLDNNDYAGGLEAGLLPKNPASGPGAYDFVKVNEYTFRVRLSLTEWQILKSDLTPVLVTEGLLLFRVRAGESAYKMSYVSDPLNPGAPVVQTRTLQVSRNMRVVA